MDFVGRARLLEQQTRWLGIILAQSEAAQQAASEISFLRDLGVPISDDGTLPGETHIPRSFDEEPPPEPPSHIEVVVDEAPDESTRKVHNTAEEKNQPGSFERLLGSFGSTKTGG